MYPSSSTSNNAVEVRRASHAHHTPHVGRPQIEPVTSVSAVKTMPTSTADTANRSQKGLRVRGHNHRTLDTAATPNARYNATHAMGGWM